MLVSGGKVIGINKIKTNSAQFSGDGVWNPLTIKDYWTSGEISSSISAVENNVYEISSYIPSGTTSGNTLTNKTWVQNEIRLMAARYLTNSAGQSFSSLEEFKEASANNNFWYGETKVKPTNNDYILVNNDEEYSGAVTRYLYVNSAWNFQYIVNNAPFTDEQWSAINSTITIDKVNNYDETSAIVYNNYAKWNDTSDIVSANSAEWSNPYVAGPNIDITNKIISGRDWTPELDTKMNLSGLEYDKHNKISGYEGSAFAGEDYIGGENIKIEEFEDNNVISVSGKKTLKVHTNTMFANITESAVEIGGLDAPRDDKPYVRYNNGWSELRLPRIGDGLKYIDGRLTVIGKQTILTDKQIDNINKVDNMYYDLYNHYYTKDKTKKKFLTIKDANKKYITKTEVENNYIKNNIGTDLVIDDGILKVNTNGSAIGYQSFVEGYYTLASGDMSHAEGHGTTAEGHYSHSEGYYTLASGQYSHAEGKYTSAIGECSHAEGYDTIANSNYSHAEGYYTSAVEEGSHAEGYYTSAKGYCSHAEGYGTSSNGAFSHAGGYYTITTNDYETVIGKYNLTTRIDSPLFVVGNGTYNNRSDAFVVFENGTVSAKTITAENYPGPNVDDGLIITGDGLIETEETTTNLIIKCSTDFYNLATGLSATFITNKPSDSNDYVLHYKNGQFVWEAV